MYNWPYAYALMNQPGSPVKGKVGLLPVVHGPLGQSTSCFGGGNLGINAYSRYPEAAWKLVHFLLQRKNRQAATEALGMLPPLKSLYQDPRLDSKFPYLKSLQEVFFTARSRPITPLYSFISDILRIHASRALTRQETPAQALTAAAAQITEVQRRFGPKGGSK
jgi:multiple sugar transport system substrate-binding protein